MWLGWARRKMRSSLFRDITRRRFVAGDRRFDETYRFHLQGNDILPEKSVTNHHHQPRKVTEGPEARKLVKRAMLTEFCGKPLENMPICKIGRNTTTTTTTTTTTNNNNNNNNNNFWR
jgi:hypothetical protein